MIRLAVGGAHGRMGRRVLELVREDDRFCVVASIDQGSSINSDVGFDVLVDFSVPEGTMRFLELCRDRTAAMVIGATGHQKEQQQRITEAAEVIPIIQSSNFSMGIHVCLEVLPALLRGLGGDCDVEIVETHHRRKVDAPSGTALTLLDRIRECDQDGAERSVVWGRQGKPGPKSGREIGVHAVRVGDTVGVHEIHFGGRGERITLRHEALSRDTFVHGSLAAAAWVVGKPPGLYTMRNVLS